MHLFSCFLYVLLFVGLTDASDVRVKSFKYKDNHKADGRDILQNVAVSSVTKCAYQCTKNEDCDDANFDKVSKLCQLLKKKPESVMLSLVEQTAFMYLGDNDEIKNAAPDLHPKTQPDYSSCKTIFDSGRSTGSKAYNLTFGMSTDWSMTYCMMDGIPGCGPGGWTLVMKINGNKEDGYGSGIWRKKIAYNEAAGQTGIEDLTETKMPSYWKTNFTKICLGMKRSSTGEVNWLKIDVTAEYFQSLFAGSTEKITTLGKPAWESLYPDNVLQQYPCKEGFNIDYGTKAKVRLGFVASDEITCASPSSSIGFGIRSGSYSIACGSTRLSTPVPSNCFIFVQ